MSHYIEYGYYQRKDGKRGRPIIVAVTLYTELRTCEMCGFTSTPKKVSARNDCYVMDWHEMWKSGTPNLCCGCWNKYRRIVYERDVLREAQRALNLLKRLCAIPRNAKLGTEFDLAKKE